MLLFAHRFPRRRSATTSSSTFNFQEVSWFLSGFVYDYLRFVAHHGILADVDTLSHRRPKAIIAWETRRKSLDQNQLFIHDPCNAYPAHFSQSPCRKGIEAKMNRWRAVYKLIVNTAIEIPLSQVFVLFIPHATANEQCSHSSCPLSSSRRFTPYDIQPRLTYKTPPTQPTLKRTPTRITLTQLNLFIAHLGPTCTAYHLPRRRPHSPTQLPAIRPTIQTQTDTVTVTVASTPSLITLTWAYFLTTSMGISSSSSSPATTTAQEHPLASLPEPDDGDVCAGDEMEDSAKGRDLGNRKAQTKGKEESRCEKICELACGGKEGRGFGESCEWEGMMMGQKGKSELSPSSSSTRPCHSRKTTISAVDSIPRATTHIETTPMQDVLQPGSTSIQIQSDDPSPLRVGLSAVPLTHMFKHSLSLLSSNRRSTLPESTITLPSDAASPGDGEASRMGTPGTPPLRRHPHSQTTTTEILLPHSRSSALLLHPRHLQWEDEEARRRSELSQEGEHWWPSSGLEGQIADSGCERPMIVTSYGMGYEDSVGQFDHQYNEQYAANATVSAPIPAWYEAPGWEAHQHQFNHPNLYFSPDDWDRIEVNKIATFEDDRDICRRPG
ncbi:uncharacterized protein LACBIDRAFT_333109 [Laccaria bicolor S238N-H82]|uniref:Predicted protein n=1 Tax=Laccaria bicolor (strain S238N-H82 / ATCC MYA-4686) TaxID=486041 RepID=B0DUW7_LACBS|nr:uncharacterized protein LACBIDRAFT_333109 [Laccaria bicolor S238N-H82]EDR01683.1 predicted protein [Laccaria bicolor S238N-H82]|eukprot:XP_001887759.1 predicted protein [Laccaria bicolor S238N-H82]